MLYISSTHALFLILLLACFLSFAFAPTSPFSDCHHFPLPRAHQVLFFTYWPIQLLRCSCARFRLPICQKKNTLTLTLTHAAKHNDSIYPPPPTQNPNNNSQWNTELLPPPLHTSETEHIVSHSFSPTPHAHKPITILGELNTPPVPCQYPSPSPASTHRPCLRLSRLRLPPGRVAPSSFLCPPPPQVPP